MTLPVSTHSACIGIIANPVSARDIRRIVANAGNLQITDRVSMLLRVLGAAGSLGVTRALMMPDNGGVSAMLTPKASPCLRARSNIPALS